jgi:hypothetical protein
MNGITYAYSSTTNSWTRQVGPLFVTPFTYQTTTNGTSNTFTLPSIPASANSLIVTANGVVQYDYTSNGANLILNFVPPSGTALRVQATAISAVNTPASNTVGSSSLQSNLVLTGNTSMTGGLTIAGNLTVQGTTTTVNQEIVNTSIVVANTITANNGLYSTNNWTGSYSDGIVVDYVTGNGRISVGGGDALSFYNGGPATTENMRIDSSGNLKLSSSGTSILNSSGRPILNQSGSVIQTQYVSSGTRVNTTYSGWNEPSTSYRVTITPTSTSSIILIRYFVPTQVNSASNVLQSFRAFRIIGGGSKDYGITSRGNTNGSRNPIAGMVNRPWNGYDSNDMMNWSVEVVDNPNTTSSIVYGFETNPESTNSTYFGYSASDNGTWGFDADIIIVAQEIAQ